MLLDDLTHHENFSATEQNIANFIMNNGERVCFMTIQELARETFSSNVAIIRLCKKLNCTGFKDFKMKYLKELEATKDNDYIDMSRPFYLNEGPTKIVSSMQKLYSQTIQACINSIDVNQLEEASAMLLKADRIFIYAVGDSGVRTDSFINRLLKLGIYPINATERNEGTMNSMNTTDKDVALFVSYSGNIESYAECVKILKAKKCPIIAITSHVTTPLTKHAVLNIRIPNRENASDNVSTFYSQIAFDFILNTLYSLMYATNYSKYHKNKRLLDAYNYASRHKDD